jgi:hypothetical protein
MMMARLGHVVRSLGVAAGLAALLLLAGAGCSSQEQSAVGTIEMGNVDKNNVGFGGAAGGEDAAEERGGRMKMDNGAAGRAGGRRAGGR